MTILYGAGISNSNVHWSNCCRWSWAEGRRLRAAGTHIDSPGTNLLVTLMDKMDVPVEHLGGSTEAWLDTLSECKRASQERNACG
jgi:hypothetical protein